jgi:glycosyltransferase involved in cell wall biosynthesis
MAKVPKVLMLVENAPVPKDSRVWPEAIALHEHGFLVSVICPKEFPQYQESYIYLQGIHVYRYSFPSIANTYISYLLEYSVGILKIFFLSFKVLFRHGFDVIHAANPPDLFFIIGLFYRLLGKKFVFDQHDITPEVFQVKFKRHGQLLHTLLLFLEWCSYRTAHVILVVNGSLKKIAVERGNLPANKVFVVRNGPRLEHTKPITPELDLKTGRRHLLAYVGVMAVQDGVEYALYALHDLVYKRGRRDVSLVLMGDGDAAAALHRLAHNLELDEYVNFTGWLERKDVLRYLTVADVGLSPDPQNGLNEYYSTIKTMEYMSLGKPVVAFDLAETRIVAQGAALYATPNVVEDFASKIEILLDDEELRVSIGAVGCKRIKDEMSWEHDKKNLRLAYKTLIPGH